MRTPHTEFTARVVEREVSLNAIYLLIGRTKCRPLSHATKLGSRSQALMTLTIGESLKALKFTVFLAAVLRPLPPSVAWRRRYPTTQLACSIPPQQLHDITHRA